MFKHKKKTGCETPKYRKPVPPPAPIVNGTTETNKLDFVSGEYVCAKSDWDVGKPGTLAIGSLNPKPKSILRIGNMEIHNTHHFNWFHRKMWKLLLGFDIENVEE